MVDITPEINAFKNAVYGEDVRDALVNLATKLGQSISDGIDDVHDLEEQLQQQIDAGISNIDELATQLQQTLDSQYIKIAKYIDFENGKIFNGTNFVDASTICCSTTIFFIKTGDIILNSSNYEFSLYIITETGAHNVNGYKTIHIADSDGLAIINAKNSTAFTDETLNSCVNSFKLIQMVPSKIDNYVSYIANSESELANKLSNINFWSYKRWVTSTESNSYAISNIYLCSKEILYSRNVTRIVIPYPSGSRSFSIQIRIFSSNSYDYNNYLYSTYSIDNSDPIDRYIIIPKDAYFDIVIKNSSAINLSNIPLFKIDEYGPEERYVYSDLQTDYVVDNGLIDSNTGEITSGFDGRISSIPYLKDGYIYTYSSATINFYLYDGLANPLGFTQTNDTILKKSNNSKHWSGKLNVKEILKSYGAASLRFYYFDRDPLARAIFTLPAPSYPVTEYNINDLLKISDYDNSAYNPDGSYTSTTTLRLRTLKSISDVTKIEIPSGIICNVFLYKGDKYLSKIGSNYSINTLSSNWANFTDGEFDIYHYLNAIDADSVRFTFKKSDGSDISYSDVQNVHVWKRSYTRDIDEPIHYMVDWAGIKTPISFTDIFSFENWDVSDVPQSMLMYEGNFYVKSSNNISVISPSGEILQDKVPLKTGHSNGFTLSQTGPYGYVSGWNNNLVYKIDLDNLTIAETYTLPFEQLIYTTVAVDDINGLMYIVYRNDRPSTIDWYRLMIWDYINNNILFDKAFDKFAAMQDIDYYNGMLYIVYGTSVQTSAKPTGFFAMDLNGKIVMRYKSPYILDNGECEGVFVDRDGSGDIYITAPKLKLRKLHMGS